MKNIALDCERMKYEHTGLYHYCLNLGRHLQLLSKADEQLSFFVPRHAPRYFGDSANYLHQHSLRKYYMPSLRKFQLWHATFQDTRYLPFRNRNIRVVLSIHDLNFMYEKEKEEKKKRYMARLQRNINRSDAIICISEYARKDVLAHCAVDENKISVIHNGANQLQPSLLTSNSYRPEKPFLFSIGVISRKKNFHALLPLLQAMPEMELVIAGRRDDEAYYQSLIMQIDKLELTGRVHILSNIGEQEKSWYYENCTAFLLPSVAEGFGLPVIEAMSLGKPTFLSTATALPEIGAKQAFYFENFNPEHMLEVYRAGMQTYALPHRKAEIIKHSNNFSWEKAAQQYWDVYRSLL